MRSVFIYGGCTSRDAVDYYPDFGLNMVGYVARQSLISAFGPAKLSGFDFSGVSGSFNQRMLKGDILSSMPRLVAEASADLDVLIWDLMIERVGVYPVPGGGMVTRNGVPRAPGTQPLGRAVVFGSHEHIDLWAHALAQFRAVLESIGAWEKVVINATPWALVDNTGNPTRSTSRMTAQWFNERVEAYWALAEASGVRVARVSQDDAIADPGHKWGPAFFHYVPETYQAQLRAIEGVLG